MARKDISTMFSHEAESARRRVTFDALDPRLQIALTPAGDLHPTDAQLRGNLLVLQHLRRKQYDARAPTAAHWYDRNARVA